MLDAEDTTVQEPSQPPKAGDSDSQDQRDCPTCRTCGEPIHLQATVGNRLPLMLKGCGCGLVLEYDPHLETGGPCPVCELLEHVEDLELGAGVTHTHREAHDVLEDTTQDPSAQPDRPRRPGPKGRRAELKAALERLGWADEETALVLEALEDPDEDEEGLGQPDRAEADVEHADQDEPTNDSDTYDPRPLYTEAQARAFDRYPGPTTQDELEQALAQLPTEQREAVERFEDAPGMNLEDTAHLHAYGENVEPPEDADTCAACAQEIRTESFAVERFGEVLTLHVCGCRLWARWEGPHDETCPVCELFAAPNLELVHTHDQPCTRYSRTELEDSDTLTYRWAEDPTHFEGQMATNTIPDDAPEAQDSRAQGS